MKDIIITIVVDGIRDFRYAVDEAAEAMRRLRVTLAAEQARMIREYEDQMWLWASVGLLAVLVFVVVLVFGALNDQ